MMEEITILKKANIRLEDGLTNEEILAIEEGFQIQFPPDLKALLQIALPVSEKFPNWRKAIINRSNSEIETIKKDIEWPLDGLLFDIEHNDVWFEQWGVRPQRLEEKIAIVKHHFKGYPILIPVYGHRYIPSSPRLIGNPIFSVWQTDIIYYGVDLCHYLKNEFEKISKPNKEPRDIPFWGYWANSSSCW
jgi:hypothetical protein